VRLLALALLVAVAAVFASAAFAQNGVIQACVKPNGNLRLVASPADCNANETPLAWNQQGPKGDKGDPGEPEVPTPRIVFVTSETFQGNLGGLDGADAICNQLATEAGLPGIYRAWLGSSTEDPIERFSRSPRPYALLDGSEVADNLDGLTDGFIQRSVAMTELGMMVTAPNVWTNVWVDGHPREDGASCDDWTSLDSVGQVGRTDANLRAQPYGWTNYSNLSCEDFAHLYCFEQ